MAGVEVEQWRYLLAKATQLKPEAELYRRLFDFNLIPIRPYRHRGSKMKSVLSQARRRNQNNKKCLQITTKYLHKHVKPLKNYKRRLLLDFTLLYKKGTIVDQNKVTR